MSEKQLFERDFSDDEDYEEEEEIVEAESDM